MVIKDKVILGSVAGIVASIPQVILNAILLRLKLTEFYDFQIAGSVYLYKYLTYTPSGLLFGAIMWESIAVGLGIIAVYFISVTGRSGWWLKGIIVSNLIMFSLIYGFFFAMQAPTIVPWDLRTDWSMLFENAVFGVCLGYLINLWNDWELEKK